MRICFENFEVIEIPDGDAVLEIPRPEELFLTVYASAAQSARYDNPSWAKRDSKQINPMERLQQYKDIVSIDLDENGTTVDYKAYWKGDALEYNVGQTHYTDNGKVYILISPDRMVDQFLEGYKRCI